MIFFSKTPGQQKSSRWENLPGHPNRDSLAYIPVYGLESAHSFIRTTLRHPDYCFFGWKNLVKAGLTNDEKLIPSFIKTISAWSHPLLTFVNDSNKYLYEQIGLFQNVPLPSGAHTSAKIYSFLEKNWKMNEADKDMILMLHEFEYLVNDKRYLLHSSLVVKGENSLRTAMAKTVGPPLGIAAKLILENRMTISGLHIPIIPEIYEPVLEELALEGIRFP